MNSPATLSSSGRGAGGGASNSAFAMENLMGLLRVRVVRGINLAVRDINSSDPYVVIKMGKQKLKTRVIRSNINPEWHEDLTLSIADPDIPIKLMVYDKDTFSLDDKMGDAEFDIKPYLDSLRMHLGELRTGTIIKKVAPCETNCLSEDSCIIWLHDKIVQNMCLRLKNVECGEVELQLQWIDLPGSRGL